MSFPIAPSKTRTQRYSIEILPNAPTPRVLWDTFLKNRSPETLLAYKQDMASFIEYLGEGSGLGQALNDLLGGGPARANLLTMDFKSWLIDVKKLQPTSVNRKLATLRSLVKMANLVGVVKWQLAVENERVTPYRDTSGPGKEFIKQMVEHLSNQRSEKAVRDLAILRLLYDLGLRRGEVCSLDTDHVELGKDRIWIKSKGSTQRIPLDLPRKTKDVLAKWLEVRGTLQGPLFINFDRAQKGKRLTGTSLYRMIRELGKQIGIITRPHGIRHTTITEACKAANRAGIPFEQVRHFSRHKDIATLIIYRDNEQCLQGQLSSMLSEEL